MGPINLAQFLAGQNGTRLPDPAIEQVMAAVNALPSEQPQDQPVGMFNDFVEEPFQIPTVPINQSESQVTKESVGTKQSGGVSVGAGQSGFSPQKFAQVQQAGNATDRAIAAGNQRVESQYADERARMDQAADMEVQAERDFQTAQNEKITADAENKRFLADIEANYRLKEQSAYKQAQANSEANFASYKAAQDEWAAMQVRPNALFEDAGPLNQFGMGVAAFVHDFLGAKGIKTSAMDTLNSAIRRNVDAQLANMTHKGNVAQGFKQMWEMQRAMSATDAEARARLHGFALKQAELNIAAEMGKYDSKLAAAKSQAAIALVRKEQAKNDLVVQKYIQDAQHQNASLLIQREGHQLSAAASKANAYMHYKAAQENRLAEEKKDARAQRAAVAKAELEARESVLFDPFDNKGKWRIKSTLSDKEKADTREKVESFESVAKDLRRLQEISRRMSDVVDGTTGTRLMNTDQANYDAIRTDLAHKIIKTYGERATDKDVEQALKSLPIPTVVTRADIQRVVSVLQERGNEAMQAGLRQRVDNIPKEQQPSFSPEQIDPLGLEEAKAVSAGGNLEPPSNDPNKPVSYADYVLHKDDAFKAKGGNQSGLQANYDKFKDSTFNTEKVGGDVDNAYDAVFRVAQMAMLGDQASVKKLKTWIDDDQEPGLNAKQSQILKDYALWEIYTRPERLAPQFPELKNKFDSARTLSELLGQ